MDKITKKQEKIYTKLFIQIEPFAVMLFEPILFAFGMFILFERFRSIIEIASTNPQYNLYQLINRDIEMNILPYVVFFILICLAEKKAQDLRRIGKFFEKFVCF